MEHLTCNCQLCTGSECQYNTTPPTEDCSAIFYLCQTKDKVEHLTCPGGFEAFFFFLGIKRILKFLAPFVVPKVKLVAQMERRGTFPPITLAWPKLFPRSPRPTKFRARDRGTSLERRTEEERLSRGWWRLLVFDQLLPPSRLYSGCSTLLLVFLMKKRIGDLLQATRTYNWVQRPTREWGDLSALQHVWTGKTKMSVNEIEELVSLFDQPSAICIFY